MSDLDKLAKSATARLEAMPPEDRIAHDIAQQESWVRGQLGREIFADGYVRLCKADVETIIAAHRAALARVGELEAERDRPETADWLKGVMLEAAHQRSLWGSEHDAGKTPLDWFWLIGYLAQKAAAAETQGDKVKAAHHTISTAAALANWHLAITGASNSMRPGMAPTADLTAKEPLA